MEQQQQQQQQQQAALEAQGVVGVDGVVEALVVSNSRLCAQVAACDARAFTEWEHARVLEEQLTESKARNSALDAEGRAKDAEITRLQLQMARDSSESKVKEAELKARLSVLEAEHKARVAILEADNSRLQLELARRDAEPSQMELHFNRQREQMAGVQQQLLDHVARVAAQPAAARAAGGAAAPAPAPAVAAAAPAAAAALAAAAAAGDLPPLPGTNFVDKVTAPAPPLPS